LFTGLENPTHLLFIAVIALIFLGPKRLPEVGRSLGSGLRNFKESISGHGAHDETQPSAALETTPMAGSAEHD
jgi:sec-independent protein translocase protein TatA